jgi:hypothetical protein
MVAARFDYDCPAVQDAIDRIIGPDRHTLFERLTGEHYTNDRFISDLMTAYKERDLLILTGRTLNWWLRLADPHWSQPVARLSNASDLDFQRWGIK